MRLLSLCALLTACAGSSSVHPSNPPRERSAPRSPLALTYLGVAGWQIDGAGRTLLVDPYFSRPALSGPVTPDHAAIAKHAPAKADLIMVAHSHIDHLLDAPEVAKRTGADLMGSTSTIRVAKASGVAAAKLLPIKGGEDYQFDGFSVRVLPGLHSALENKHTLGWLNTEIPESVTLPLTFEQYAEGGTFAYYVRLAGHEIYVQSSANFIERELVGLRPDIAIIAPGLREEIYDYTCRLLRTLGNPPTVYVTHFDKWREPLGTPPESQDAFVAEVKACAPGTQVIVPRVFELMNAP